MTSSPSAPSLIPDFRPKTIGLIAGVLVLHVGMGWLLLQIKPITLPPPKPKPIQIKMVQLAPPPPPVLPAQPKKPEPPKPIEPPKPVQIVERLPPEPVKPKPVPVIAAKPTPAVEPKPVTPVAVAAPAPIDVDPPPAIVAAPAPAKPEPAPVVSNTPKNVSISGVKWKKQVQPEYPEHVIEQLEAGVYVTIIQIEIDVDGKVRSTKIQKSSGQRAIDQINRRAAERSTFFPYQENGVGIVITVPVPYEFKLNKEE